MATSRARRSSELAGEALVAEEHAFRRKLPQLMRRYAGEFVALYLSRVVGHDSDDENLARQMFEKLGDVPFYIGKVDKEPAVYELPSPESVR